MAHVLETYAPPTFAGHDEVHVCEHAVVLNKPSGLLSVPGKPAEHNDSLLSRAQSSYGRVFAVHRLDLETSGLMMLARSKAALAFLSRQFEHRTVSKTYAARLHGLVSANEGEIDLPLICDWPNRPRQKVDHDIGKPALTRFKVLSRHPEDDCTQVEFYPETGRSHQLRVHAVEMGHPILGDPIYAPPGAKKAAPRLQLHAERLEIILPEQTERSAFHCAAPF